MSTVPEGAKKPTDRKPKSDKPDDSFSFEYADKKYTFKPTDNVLTPGFLRAHRRRDELDAFFTMVEELADEKQLKVIDKMSRDEFGELVSDFYVYLDDYRDDDE